MEVVELFNYIFSLEEIENMKKVFVMLFAALMASVSQASWVLVDDFESYDNSADTHTTIATGGVWTSVFDGTGNSHIIDTDAGQVLQAKGGAAWRGAEYDLSGTDAAVLVDEVQTFFFQVEVSYSGEATTNWVYDFMMGLSPDVSVIDDVDAWADFSAMPYINNAADTPYINANGSGTWWAPMSADTMTNVWLVVDNDATAPTFDLYYSTGTDAATLVVEGANWRYSTVGVDLNALGFMAAGAEFTEYLVDNIYYADGEDLSNPVPEPATMLLMGLGSIAAIRRRK